ncbi:MAG: beta-lactamase family protein [Fibrobacterales bacterium]
MLNSALSKIISDAIEDQLFPGCCLGTVDVGGTRSVAPFGFHTYDNKTPVAEQSLYDCASITKSVPTALLALKLIDAGELSLDDPVNRYIDGYQLGIVKEVLVKHLLTHTVDYRFSLAGWKDRSPIEILEKLYTHPFNLPPGESFCYCNASSVMLGVLMSELYSMPFEEAAQREVFDPLMMHNTGFFPKERFELSAIVPSEDDTWRERIIQGEVHDESAYALRELFVAGSAGLFSTVPDLLNPMEMLLHKGSYNGVQFLSEAITEQVWTNQIQSIGLYTGLGFELNQERYMGVGRSKQTFGKTGFTGCHFLGDVSKGKAVVLLSNVTWPNREESPERIHRFRGVIADEIFGVE